MPEQTLVVILIAVILIQQVYWASQVHRLIDKLMSRNFAEYNSIVNPPKEETKVPAQEPVTDDEALATLNRMFS